MKFGWILLMAAIGAAPATRPTAPQRLSADRVPFPDATSKAVPMVDLAPGRTQLKDVATLLLRRPDEIGVKVYSAAKSREMLRSRLTYKRETANVSHVTTGTETTHGTATMRGAMDAQWFAITLGNADVAGLELTDGIITRIILFYKDARVAARMGGEYLTGEPCPWCAVNDGGAVRLEAAVSPLVLYLATHPNLSQPIREAMIDTNPVHGMTIEEALITFGKPEQISDGPGGAKEYTWREWQPVRQRAIAHIMSSTDLYNQMLANAVSGPEKAPKRNTRTVEIYFTNGVATEVSDARFDGSSPE